MAKKTSNVVVMLVLGILLLTGGIVYMFSVQQSQLGEEPKATIATSCGDSTGVLTVNSYSRLNPSTAVSSPTITAGINDGVVATSVTSGTTTFAVGSKVKVLVSKADYLDEEFEFTMPCGGMVLAAPLYYSSSTNPTVRIKNSDGDYVTNSATGGAVNQTSLSSGDTLRMDVELTGKSLESSGDLIYVMEFPTGSAANITKVELSGAEVVAIPKFYSSTNAGSKVVAFKIPAIVGSSKSIHSLTVTLGSTKDLAGGVLTNWYAAEKFVDTDGTIQYGVENSEGTAKYENTGSFDFYINA